ncbi:MAG: UDP-N-acetylglucosamine 1-carboxyvinyltransferase [Patescibacteria group bacterium]|jgi:UDP-N-acetylglucosamine 1-carboxyvinyltransferase
MPKFIISGGAKIGGEIKVGGAKNAALKIFPAAILFKEKIRITNVPDIEDVHRCEELLKDIGALVNNLGNGVYEVDASNINKTDLNPEIVKKFRSSIMFVGPLLARAGQARFPHPGGCVIGAGGRPIDLFLDGFSKMGVELKTEDKFYHLFAKNIFGTQYFFSKVTVTGTESIMMTAVLAKGTTVLKNCALEPEITALADFLNSCGAKISGAGTPTITIEGVDGLRGGEYRVIPDRIETGTFAIMAAVLNNKLKITDCNPEHVGALWPLFDKIGVNYELGHDYVVVHSTKGPLKACSMQTHEYPGFATDLQSPYVVLATQCQGLSLIHETIYDRRLLFTDMLTQMGANIIMCDPHRVVVSGPTKLYAKKLVSPDLRAGITMVIAGMIAEGTTEIDNIYQIERGYEKIVERLIRIGVNIKKTEE